MKLLLDTNIFLEIILDQEQASDAKELLLHTDQHDLYLSDYTLHSIGLLLFHRKQHQAFQSFVQDVVLEGGVGVLSLPSEELKDVIRAAQEFQLDFDDAYQYTLALNNQLKLVSFDTDFNRTDQGRKTPAEIL
jgi:predicted nucleic acid-binding protein